MGQSRFGGTSWHQIGRSRRTEQRTEKHRSAEQGRKGSLAPQLTQARSDRKDACYGRRVRGRLEELRAELLEQYAPQSAMEAELVERLAVTLWRLRRVPFFEAAILDARYHQVYEIKEAEAAQKYSRSAWMAERSESEEEENRLESDEDDNEEDEEAADREKSVHFGLALIRDGFHDDALGKLSRHETSLMNALTKTLQLLLLVQENRDNSNVIEVTPVVALPKAA